MLTEHSVTYETPGGKRVITRTVYAPSRSDRDRRILGTEITREEWWDGYDASARGGPNWRESCTETRQFGHISEAQDWMTEMLSTWEVYHVQNGILVKPGNECT